MSDIKGKKVPSIGKKKKPELSPWDIVKISRHPERPVFQDYIGPVFEDFIEMHGDRYYSDDKAIIGGFARINGKPIMLIGQYKGKNTEEQIARNFGMGRPEGYRKALRLMHLAERFNIPVVTVIDTPGAFPGMHAEERGQAESIAKNITEMASLKVAIVCIVIGEGGSGGALGIGVGDRILMLSNAIYSVISPEGCASILWRDANFAPQAAEALNLTAEALLYHGVIDEIITEPGEGAHTDYTEITKRVKKAIVKHLDQLLHYKSEELRDKRFEKYARMGKFAVQK